MCYDKYEHELSKNRAEGLLMLNRLFKKKEEKKDPFVSGLYGFVIGDAFGLPIEFMNRDRLKQNPVTDMIPMGTYRFPIGTWSDDSSMIFATMDAFKKETELPKIYRQMLRNFLDWKHRGEFTPNGEMFDIEKTTAIALRRYQIQVLRDHPEHISCGMTQLSSNGNGSLMRILPVAFYLYQTDIDVMSKEAWEMVKTVSSMTHAHIYSVLGCYIYVIYVIELLKGCEKHTAYQNMQEKINQLEEYQEDLHSIYKRISTVDLATVKEEKIGSSGYIVETLEAVLWSILTTDSFSDAVVCATNLGDDTDTIGALTGALAGIIYGYEAIPEKWLNYIKKRKWVDQEIASFDQYLKQLSMETKKDEK